MTAARVFRRAAEAFASRPGGHEMQQLALAAIEWSREWRRERDRKPGKAEPREDSRGSFAGLTRGPDGTLEPCGGVTHAYPAAAMPAGLRKACEHRPADGIPTSEQNQRVAGNHPGFPDSSMRECKNHSGGPEGSW